MEGQEEEEDDFGEFGEEMWKEGQEVEEGKEDEEICGESEEKSEESEEARRYWRKVSEETGGAQNGVQGEVGREKAGVDDREVKMMGGPRRPSQAEVEDHARRNHCPYRNWCGVCVSACGRDLDHRADSGKERGLSEFSFDYCFPGDEFGCKLTTLVGRERKTGCSMATAVPMKGSTGMFTIDKVLEFID